MMRGEVARILVVFAGILLLTIMPLTGYTAVPQKVNYQGYLTDSGGVPVDGQVQITFAVYDVDTGGTALWNETQTVTVIDGVFNVNLGDINPLGLAFDAQYYLGVQVGSDEEMTPRSPLTSAGYSFSTDKADYAVDADMVDGYQGAGLEESAEIDADIAAHTAVSDSHHLKTTSFSELTDQISDSQVPAGIARDTEITSEVSSHTSRNDNPHQVTASQVGAAIDLNCTGCVSQSELDFSPAGAFTDTGSSAYYMGGNVGIGTTNPDVWPGSSILHVQDGPRPVLKIEGTNSDSTATLVMKNDTQEWHINAGRDSLGFWNRAKQQQMLTIANSGSIGIGTTAPRRLLHLDGGTTSLARFDSSVGHDYTIGAYDGYGFIMVDDTYDVYRMVIADSGNVGIGTHLPQRLLHLDGGTTSLARFDSSVGHDYTIGAYDGYGFIVVDDTHSAYRMVIADNGMVGIGTYQPNWQLHVVGDIAYTGNIFDVSDLRNKENIIQMENAIEKISSIRGVYFNNIGESPEKREVGVIAQDVETVLPEIVSEDIEGYKMVDYSKLTPLLIEAIKELKAENDALKALVCLDHPEAEICR